jgi:hypothetical protein
LYPGSNIGSFSQCQLLLTLCSTHFSDNDQPSMDTDTDGELYAFVSLQTGIQVFYGGKHT